MSKQKNKNTQNTAIISFLGEVEAKTLESFITTINGLPSNIDTLCILLTTGGGTVMHGIAFYNYLKSLPHHIIMHNLANVDSVGNFVFMAGHERYAVPNATFFIHGVRSEISEGRYTKDSLRERCSSIEEDDIRIRDALMKHTKLQEKEIEGFFNSGVTMNAETALKKGMIDKICDIKIPAGQKLLVVSSY